MLDFYIEKQWESLPQSWQYYFEENKNEITNIALSLLDNSKTSFHDNFPESLLKFKNDIQNIINNAFMNESSYQVKAYDFSKVPKMLLAKIKRKKIHELQYLIPLISHLYTSSNGLFNEIVDFGAGIGHLSRILAYCIKDLCDVTVSTVEGNDNFVREACKLDQDFEKKLKHQTKQDIKLNIKRSSKMVYNEEDITNNSDLTSKKLIIGLHTCGDFASTLIRHFQSNSNVTGLINVGCCYHKINNAEDMMYRQIYESCNHSDVPSYYNYPMSSDRNKFPNLSYAARELACHSLDKFTEKLHDKSCLKSFKINLFRAKLEYIIFLVTKKDANRHLGLNSVQFRDDLSFDDYIEEALQSHKDVRNEINQFKCDSHESYYKMIQIDEDDIWRIFVLYVIRLSIAPIIETTILLDRLIFLKEHDLKPYLVKLFDPKMSPRCSAIVCKK
uniref:Methyltranfer_dom domain-containing protein n=1 Tax=Parastrongyloides trichosuri TaxID=131310 RepID=A0A0N4ZZ21_PARTI